MKSKRMLSTLLIIVLILLMGVSGLAKNPEKSSKKLLGEALVKKLWADMKAGNIESIKSYMADGFHSGDKNGTRNAAEELRWIEELDLVAYKLTDFSTTYNGNTLIVTYFVSIQVLDKGKVQPYTPTVARMSTFVKTADGWKWMGQANLL